ncbi:probable FMP21 Found in Mitochondrial Proteome [Phialocephala subalpina]|uniref:Succinate dehydrogenase assembly factor 4, mitochondrial n=1 Tax=Phialocephala subalpina TaxID=576137 RepID=A0A1L7WIL3_9HELO|nr:probable FMP21 Found in Mitochondrial Proteome [Phialocephala subalpina]
MSRLLPPRFLLPSRRFFTQTTRRTAFATGPAPPRLPPKEQEEFERLQKSSTGAFSTPKPSVTTNPTAEASSPPRTRPQINQSPASTPDQTTTETAQINARVQASGKGEELHPDIRRGAKPEFEGDRNPKTGEVGGPKNEPLRWGSTGERGDWSYNGRVTDF